MTLKSRIIFDIDIDISNNVNRSDFGTRAMIYNDSTETISPHPAGVYLEDVPTDQLTSNCAFDYKYGNERGFMKVDLLTNNAYNLFKDKQDVLDAIKEEPDWSMLKDRSIVEKLPHVANHFDLVSKVSPKSIEDLADVLALMRPGKLDKLDDYLDDREKVRRQLYRRPKSGMHMKKSHCVAYALMIVAIMNKMDKSRIKF